MSYPKAFLDFFLYEQIGTICSNNIKHSICETKMEFYLC